MFIREAIVRFVSKEGKRFDVEDFGKRLKLTFLSFGLAADKWEMIAGAEAQGVRVFFEKRVDSVLLGAPLTYLAASLHSEVKDRVYLAVFCPEIDYQSVASAG